MNTNACDGEVLNKRNTEKKPFSVCCSSTHQHKYYIPVASKRPHKRKLHPNSKENQRCNELLQQLTAFHLLQNKTKQNKEKKEVEDC
jgi:hypothetical protein